MVYDPVEKKWKGNESILRDFEKVSKPVVRPTLITQTSAQASGQSTNTHGMVFDPVLCVWKGNDEDARLFDEIDAFEQEQSGINSNLTNFLESKMGLVCDKELRDAWTRSETKHKLLIGSWFPKACDSRWIRDTSKTHMYDIRTIQIK